MTTTLTTDLTFLCETALAREEENEHFKRFLDDKENLDLDTRVHRLNNDISAKIDCTRCGNCCRSLIINIEPEETRSVSEHLSIPLQLFKEKYVEESQQGQWVINTIPCHFLRNNKCDIYEQRFLECREFPHLHKKGFRKRLPGTLMHYGSCPIIYNVIEELKVELSFKPE